MVRDDAKPPTLHWATLTARKYLAPNVNSAEAEKLGSKEMVYVLPHWGPRDAGFLPPAVLFCWVFGQSQGPSKMFHFLLFNQSQFLFPATKDLIEVKIFWRAGGCQEEHGLVSGLEWHVSHIHLFIFFPPVTLVPSGKCCTLFHVKYKLTCFGWLMIHILCPFPYYFLSFFFLLISLFLACFIS